MLVTGGESIEMGIAKYFQNKARRRIPSKLQRKKNNSNVKVGYQHNRPQISLDNAIKTKKQRSKKRFKYF